MRFAVLCFIGLLWPGFAAAAMPDLLQQKVETLVKESDGIAKQRHKWETVQQALMTQKQQIEATQKAIEEAQDALNQRTVSHNQQVAAQQQALKAKKSDCQAGDSSAGHVDDCDKDIKDLNQKTGTLNADVGTVETDQAKLDAQYAQANQDASDWNAHESLATQHLNEVYQAGNDWLDRAYTVIVDDDFRDAVTATGSDAYCENRGLPTGKLSIPTLNRLSDAYRKCLKTVLSAEQKGRGASPGAPAVATKTPPAASNP